MAETSEARPRYGYKILRASEWQDYSASNGGYKGTALDISDGFMHMSVGSLVELVSNAFFSDLKEGDGCHMLKVDLSLVASDIVRWEDGTVSGQKYSFPHLYSPLQKEAVVKVYEEFVPATFSYADLE
eukprot:TRINITY_DN11231_c0_g1_i1.p1 TRINITY_DN11231_c0_g1~~TRINITY_DN11231_c0_g1_i1.p1  ORF type:complete len:135 (+),score=16.93 TRINITY_DN11231_c0_g1_i1:22-405(+)